MRSSWSACKKEGPRPWSRGSRSLRTGNPSRPRSASDRKDAGWRSLSPDPPSRPERTSSGLPTYRDRQRLRPRQSGLRRLQPAATNLAACAAGLLQNTVTACMSPRSRRTQAGLSGTIRDERMKGSFIIQLHCTSAHKGQARTQGSSLNTVRLTKNWPPISKVR
jgi:hypothetical protein